MMKPNLRFIGRSTLTLLIVLTAIFLRGNLRDFTVLGLLVAVVTYNLFVFFRPKWMLAMEKHEEDKTAAKAIKPRKPVAQPQHAPATPPQAPQQAAQMGVSAAPTTSVQPNPNVQEQFHDTLIRHVNYRITEKLKGVYPEATWSWCIKDPVALIQTGGATRIRTFHTEGHNFAEIEFSQNGNFRICMIQVTELEAGRKPIARPADAAREDEIDPDNINLYDWYEMTASAIVRATIDEVNTRGHQVLYIDASGDIFTKEGDESIRQGKVGFMPSPKLWEELTPFFAEDDITAVIDGEILALTWGN